MGFRDTSKIYDPIIINWSYELVSDFHCQGF